MPSTKVGVVKEDVEIIKSDMKDVKESLNSMSLDFKEFTDSFGAILKNLVGRVDRLEQAMKKKTDELEVAHSRIDHLEQYTRMDNIIINGLVCKSYAEMATPNQTRGATSAPVQHDIMEGQVEQVIQFLRRDVGVNIKDTDISVVHDLPSRIQKGGHNKNIIVKFTNRRAKEAVMKNKGKLRGKNIYINEHLTGRNAHIFRKARELRKLNKVEAAWTRNCQVLVRTPGDPEHAKTLVINCMEDFTKFKLS